VGFVERMNRTEETIADHVALRSVVKMDPAPATPPITIYSFNSNLPPVNQEIDLVSGSDIDIGGYTTAKFTPVPISSESSSSSSTLHGLPTPPPSPTSTGSSTPNSVLSHIAFHGTMSLKVPPQYADKVKAGYAGMRNRRRTTLFGEDTWDLGSYTHIKVVVAYRGWEGWRNRWYCNVQTDGPIL
jgi:NADH dehydrogenase [ubiquinone] 1 alpha subcomplex assembly factor 1